MTTRPNIEELDRLWKETSRNWEAESETLLFHGEGRLAYARGSDAAFIVAAHNAYPALSAYVRHLESGIEEAQRAMHDAGYKSAAAMLNPLVRKP